MLSTGITVQNKNTLGFSLLEKTRLNSFFLLLFIFQIIFVFQGLDFGDEGFHSTFYQRIFKDPQSVEYNFMFWLSGIIGGAWLRLFPEYGLLGLRLGGVIVNMLTIMVTYNLLKNYIRQNHLKLGLLLLVLLNGAAVKDLSYNNISALFFVISIWFLADGLIKKRDIQLIFSGIFLSLAVFSRLSNASGMALISIVVYSGFFAFKRSIPQQVKQILIFTAGFILGVLTMLGLMKMIGHYGVFMNSLKLLKEIATSKESTHGIANLIKILLKDYSTAVFKRALPVATIVLVCASLQNYYESNTRLNKILPYFFSVAFLLFLTGVLIMKGTLTVWMFIILLFAALSLIACLSIIFRKGNNELKIISLAGTVMTFSLISGSDYGITASGSTALWVGMPIATDFFLRICSVNANGSYFFQDYPDANSQNRKIALSVTDRQLKVIWKWGIYSSVVLLLLHSVFYTYNDNPNRMKMTSSVHNSFLKGVFTTKVRADAIDEFLLESSKYFKQNDYLIVYKDVPMLYTLTETRPFLRSSWLGIYDKTLLDIDLNNAVKEKHVLPPIVYQKVKTLPGPYWPDADQDNSSLDIDNAKNRSIKKFIEKNHYKLAWENIAFRIFIVEENAALLKPNL